MGKLIVTAFTTLDNIAEEPHLWSGQFFSDSTGAFYDEVLAEADSMLSGTLEHADWNNSTIISDDVPGRVRALRERENVLVWGSPTLVRMLDGEPGRRVRSAGLTHRARAGQKPYLRTEPGTPCGSSNSGCLRAECSHCG